MGEGSKVSRSSVICSACSCSSSMYRAQSKISPSSSLRDTQILTHGAHWWMVDERSPFALILTGQGQNGYFVPLCSAVCAHPLPARSCSLKIGDLQKAAIVPEDECCLMSIFIWRFICSLLYEILPFFFHQV